MFTIEFLLALYGLTTGVVLDKIEYHMECEWMAIDEHIIGRDEVKAFIPPFTWDMELVKLLSRSWAIELEVREWLRLNDPDEAIHLLIEEPF